MARALRAMLWGGAAGAVLGLLGSWRAASEGEPIPADVPWLLRLGAPAVVGSVAGAMLAIFRRFRRRGLVWHYSTWLIACTGGAAVLGVIVWLVDPTAEGTEALGALLFMGILAGLGLAAFARWVSPGVGADAKPER